MKIKIKKNAYVFAENYSLQRQFDFRGKLKEVEGQWLEVDTSHLFDNQYNTKCGLRIYDSMVEAVEGDVRHKHKKCKYCGAMMGIVSPDCQKHLECKGYGMFRFTPENTYFLQYPNGVKFFQDENVKSMDDEPHFGTYRLSFYPDLDYMRISNCRKTINFKYDGKHFFVCNGIGYDKQKRLDMPRKDFDKLVLYLKHLIKEGEK